MPRFELTRYPTDNIISRLYILGFRPPELLSEKPIEVSSNSPDDIILLICSLNVACFTSNNSHICFCVSQTVSTEVQAAIDEFDWEKNSYLQNGCAGQDYPVRDS